MRRTFSASTSFHKRQLITSFSRSAAAHRPPGMPEWTPELQHTSRQCKLIMKRLRDALLLSVKVHLSVASLPKSTLHPTRLPFCFPPELLFHWTILCQPFLFYLRGEIGKKKPHASFTTRLASRREICFSLAGDDFPSAAKFCFVSAKREGQSRV